jgi:hypothetical protein
MLKQKPRMENKSSYLPAILIAMAVRRCDTKHIAQCSMPGLLRKPLDATIWRLLTPYCYRPGGRQGDNQHNNDAKYPPIC